MQGYRWNRRQKRRYGKRSAPSLGAAVIGLALWGAFTLAGGAIAAQLHPEDVEASSAIACAFAALGGLLWGAWMVDR